MLMPFFCWWFLVVFLMSSLSSVEQIYFAFIGVYCVQFWVLPVQEEQETERVQQRATKCS